MLSSRPASHIEWVSNSNFDSYGQNYLHYNAAVGVFSSRGEIEELCAFLSSMKPHHIHSFMGSTFSVSRLDKPLIVYRVGEIGKFWSVNPPSSPWQQALDCAMHPSLYPSSMKEIANFHPANKGILIYEVPAGELIATGNCASMGSFPGNKNQIYMGRIDSTKVKMVTWTQWLESNKTQLAFISNWNEYRINHLNFKIKNPHSLNIKNQPKAVQSVLKIWDAKSNYSTSSSNQLKLNESVLVRMPSLVSNNMVTTKLPWYRLINLEIISHYGLRIVSPILLGLDASNRLTADKEEYPEYSEPAHFGAVATDMFIDTVLFTRLVSLTSFSQAIPVLALINLNCEIANKLRYISVESMVNKRDVFLVNLYSNVESTEMQEWLLKDFEKGGSKSRDFNRSAIYSTKAFYKLFEPFYDMKKSPGNLVREIGNIALPKMIIKEEPVMLADISYSMLGVPRTRNQKNAVIPKHENELSFAIEHEPVISESDKYAAIKALFNQTYELDGSEIKLSSVDANATNNLAFNGFVTSPNDVASNKVSISVRTNDITRLQHVTPYRPPMSSPPTHPTIKGSLFERMPIAAHPKFALTLGNSAFGIAYLVENGASITAAYQGGDVVVLFDALLTKESLVSMLSSLWIGAVVFGGALTCQLLLKSYNKKLIHEYKELAKASRRENTAIHQSLEKVYTRYQQINEETTSVQWRELYDDVNGLLSDIKHSKRKEYSRAIKSDSIVDGSGKQYYLSIAGLQKNESQLSLLNDNLYFNYKKYEFYENHKNDTADDLAKLKSSLASEASIEAWGNLMFVSAINLANEKNIQSAKNQMDIACEYQYFASNKIAQLSFSGMGYISKNVKTIENNLNKKIININKQLENNEDSRKIAKEIRTYLRDVRHEKTQAVTFDMRRHSHTNFLTINEYFGYLKANRKNLLGRVYKDEWMQREAAFANKLMDLENLANELEQHGNQPSTLPMQDARSTFAKFLENEQDIHAYYLERLHVEKEHPELVTKNESIILEAVAYPQLLDHADKRRALGFTRESAEIYQELGLLKDNEQYHQQSKKDYFTYHGQLISAFETPVTSLISLYLKSYSDSISKRVALSAIEAVNTVQIAVPNAIPLTMQGVYGQSIYWHQSVNDAMATLRSDINAMNFNGSMIVSQLMLKALPWMSIEEKYKTPIISGGNNLFTSISFGKTLHQLYSVGLQAPSSPNLLATTINHSVNAICSVIEYHGQIHGRSLKHADYYRVKDTFKSMILATSLTNVVLNMTDRSKDSWLVNVAALLGFCWVAYTSSSSATKNSAIAHSLSSRLSDIQYYLQRNNLIEFIDYYLNEVDYVLLLSQPTEDHLLRVKNGKAIFIVRTFEDENDIQNKIYCLGVGGGVRIISLSNYENTLFNQLFNYCGDVARAEQILNNDETQKYNDFIVLVRHVIETHIAPQSIPFVNRNQDASWVLVESDHYRRIKNDVVQRNHLELIKLFKVESDDELCFNSHQDEINQLRVRLHELKVQYFYNLNDFDTVNELTDIYSADNQSVIHSIFRIPAYLAFNSIEYRLTGIAKSETLLSTFSDNYQIYVQLIEFSALENKQWFQKNWSDIKLKLNTLMSFALQQFVLLARKSSDQATQLKLLGFITSQYYGNGNDDWRTLLSDELKFCVSKIYMMLGRKNESQIFFDQIKDIVTLIRKYLGESSEIIDIFIQLNEEKCRQYIKNQDDIDIIKSIISGIFKNKQFQEAKFILKNAKEFNGRKSLLARAIYFSTYQTELFEPIQLLLEDNKQSNCDWNLMYTILWQ